MPTPDPEKENIIGLQMFYLNEPVNIVGIDFTDGADSTAIVKNPHSGKEWRIPYPNAYALAREWNINGEGKKVY